MTDPETGEWQCTLRVTDPKLREMIASGQLRAFSIHAAGKRKLGLFARIWAWVRRVLQRVLWWVRP